MRGETGCGKVCTGRESNTSGAKPSISSTWMLDRSACAVFSQGKPHEVPWLIRPIQEIEGSPTYSQSFTARLKSCPDTKHEFFCSV
jgi:hypothetical protein